MIQLRLIPWPRPSEQCIVCVREEKIGAEWIAKHYPGTRYEVMTPAKYEEELAQWRRKR